VLIVVLFSKALTLVYLLMNEDVLVDRQYSHGVALTLRAYWAADEENRDKIAEAAGLIRVTGSGVPEGEQHWPYSEIYQRQMQAELGRHRSAAAHACAAGVVGQCAEPGAGLAESAAVPASVARAENLERAGLVPGHRPVVHRFGVDFRAPAQPAAQTPGVRRPPAWPGRSVRLPISDTPSEMTEVYKAFNQMAEDVEQAGRERELMLAGVPTTCARR
jgi:two-component system osmolarity sensor histidine kinase EnvZ